MSHYTSVVDGMNDVLDFEMNRGYYDPRPFHVAGSLSSQAGQGLRREAPRAAAAEGDGTLHKWYVTRLSQPHTGSAPAMKTPIRGGAKSGGKAGAAKSAPSPGAAMQTGEMWGVGGMLLDC